MPIIQANHISKQYQTHLALNDVSISIDKGSIFGLLGPNGAGKTTFIRILNQIILPDTGEVLFDGEKLCRKHIERVGYLPEERGLYKKMKVGEQALYLARLKGLDRQTAMNELKKWFVKFEITSWWNKKVEELSKGMAQKVQFITTVLHKPDLLIFDEPFSGLDPVNVNILKEEIINLKNEGATVIFSTHNMESVEELCDSIALIDHSQTVLDGKVREIKRKYKSNKFSFEIDLTSIEDAAKISSLMSDMHYVMESSELNDNHLKCAIAHDVLSERLTVTSNEIISTLLPMGNISSFEEIIPSMNNIFLMTVKKSSHE
ncbi:MAG: ATP-binding cassette domain-containing protein [Bacteroidales bacterium]|nr:ATP-binding cassette domain-containing protein [Bacteroidales bacterium]